MKDSYGYLVIAVASVIWGTMGIFGKLAFEYGIHPETLIALRLLIAFLTILIPMALLKRELFKIHKTDIASLLALGIFAIALQRVTYFYAVYLTTATIAAILFYTYPIFVTLYSALFRKEKATLAIAFAIILTFSGAALVVKAYDVSRLNATLLGVVSGLLSSILFALYFLLVKKMRNRYTNWTLLVYGDGIGAAFLAPLLCSSYSDVASYPQQFWVLIFTIAWFPSLLAYLLYSYALKHVESSRGSILSVIEPLSAAFFSVAILGESFEPLQLMGVALALIGVVLLFYKPRLKG